MKKREKRNTQKGEGKKGKNPRRLSHLCWPVGEKVRTRGGGKNLEKT